ncbi:MULTISPECIES: hypothetical protein [unclassified Sphingobacterium]|nr:MULTISPECIES: hypothetical protein [unclassified Sphingobacterium]
MAEQDIAISYARNSQLTHQSGIQQLVLAHQSELAEVANVPCFFRGV